MTGNFRFCCQPIKAELVLCGSHAYVSEVIGNDLEPYEIERDRSAGWSNPPASCLAGRFLVACSLEGGCGALCDSRCLASIVSTDFRQPKSCFSLKWVANGLAR